jgi:hypothetical protein
MMVGTATNHRIIPGGFFVSAPGFTGHPFGLGALANLDSINLASKRDLFGLPRVLIYKQKKLLHYPIIRKILGIESISSAGDK